MLRIFHDIPLGSGTECNQDDTFTGDAVTTTFNLVNKTSSQVGPTIEYTNTQVSKANGGFVVNANNSVTLTNAPPLSATGVIPGLSNVVIGLVYDQLNVPAVPGPSNVIQTPAWIADPDTIHLYSYTNISASIIDTTPDGGALTSFCQLASAQPNFTGSPFTFLVSGTALGMNDLSAFGLVTSSVPANSTVLYVDQASSFNIGDYIKVNSGNSTQEITRITAYTAPNQLTVDQMNFAHSTGETVYACGRKFWIQTTIPINFVNGVATTYWNLAVQPTHTVVSRR